MKKQQKKNFAFLVEENKVLTRSFILNYFYTFIIDTYKNYITIKYFDRTTSFKKIEKEVFLMNTAVKLNFEETIRNININLIEDKRLQQAVFHLNNFYQPIKFGNLLFNYKDMAYYRGFDINKMTLSQLEELINKRGESLHCSQSTYIGYKRSYATAVSNSGFIVDVDYYNVEEYKHLTAYELIEVMEKDGAFNMLKPSYFINSGNGLYIVYLLNNVSVNTNLNDLQNMAHQKNIEKRRSIIISLIKNFEKYGSDKKCNDLTRIYKMPGTINFKTGNDTEIMYFDKVKNKPLKRYTLGHLYNKFLDKGYVAEPKPKKVKEIEPFKVISEPKKQDKPKKINKKTKINTNNDTCKEIRTYAVNIDGIKTIRNGFTLNKARIDDLETLLNIRNYNFYNLHIRNTYLHIYSVYLRKITDDLEEIFNKVKEINSSFDKPIENIDYLKNQIYRDELNYNYKNQDIIDMLLITPDEEKQLKTIISREEYNRRRREKDKNKRKNSNGLTNREQQKADNMEKIKQLLQEGYNKSEITNMIGISIRMINKYINELNNMSL